MGIFGIGQLPKGDKDPFALRRAAIGVLRIVVEKQLQLDLVDLVERSRELFGDKLTNNEAAEQVVDFVLGRFRTWYEEQGIDVDVIQAVMARRPTRPADFAARVHGVTAFKQLDSAEALAAANKRVANILNKNNVTDGGEVNAALFENNFEQTLSEQINAIQTRISPMLEQGNYADVLTTLAELREAIDAFFDNVMVMADDADVRNNRLALLSQLRALFLYSADISQLSQ